MDEIERLHGEVRSLREEIKDGRLAKYDDKINHRTLPPMAQMTRLQKRLYLEPWFTVGMVASAFIAAVAWILACILPWHVELACGGTVFALSGVGFLIAKMWHQDANTKFEGELRARDRY